MKPGARRDEGMGAMTIGELPECDKNLASPYAFSGRRHAAESLSGRVVFEEILVLEEVTEFLLC